MRKISSFIVIIAIFTFVVGCSRQYEAIVYGEDRKIESLQSKASDFHQAVYWGDSMSAVKFVDRALAAKIMAVVPKESRTKQFVKFSPLEIKLDEDDSSVGIITMDIQVFKVPNYKIENKTANEKWEFRRFGGGWYLKTTDIFD